MQSSKLGFEGCLLLQVSWRVSKLGSTWSNFLNHRSDYAAETCGERFNSIKVKATWEIEHNVLTFQFQLMKKHVAW